MNERNISEGYVSYGDGFKEIECGKYYILKCNFKYIQIHDRSLIFLRVIKMRYYLHNPFAEETHLLRLLSSPSLKH